MPVPADSVAPFAVLVLAWDEATPAVRTLLAAVQTDASPIDSILMMVPQAEAPEALSAEEYLPLPTTAIEELVAQLATLPLTQAQEEELQNSTLAETASASSPELLSSSPPATIQPKSASATEAAPLFADAPPGGPPTTPALPWATVRVLRLSGFSLPELAERAGQPLPTPTWTASTEFPATPYLGATPLASQLVPAAPATLEPSALAKALTMALPPSQPAPTVMPLVGTPIPAKAPAYLAAEPAALAPDLEADTLPTAAEKLASFELTHANLPPADDTLAIDELASAASPAPTEQATKQAGWPEALAALCHVAPLAEPSPPTAPTDELAPLIRPATRSYSAPDLNFQVIQYARFAVPLALAEMEFTAIYAPAWPTWLAAQELRQRTGQPLVLHVAALAAPAEESLDTATGWVAELQRQALRRADCVLTETTALAYRLRHELGLPASAVRTVAATDAAAIAQVLRNVQPRAKASLS
jgi:hypothetical protein